MISFIFYKIRNNTIVQSLLIAVAILAAITLGAFVLIEFLIYSCKSNSILLLLTPLIIITVIVVTAMVYHYKKSKEENKLTITDEIIGTIAKIRDEFSYAPRISKEYLGPGVSAYQFWLEAQLAKADLRLKVLESIANTVDQVSLSEIKTHFPEDRDWSLKDQESLCVTFNELLANRRTTHEEMAL